jgi:hypothetical protein
MSTRPTDGPDVTDEVYDRQMDNRDAVQRGRAFVTILIRAPARIGSHSRICTTGDPVAHQARRLGVFR